MKIETERLEMIALTPDRLALWTNDTAKLEKEMDCTYLAEPMEGIFREIVCGQVDKAQNDPDNYQWHTFWFMIRKSDRSVVGSIDFKDVPSPEGKVEIGYGLGKEFEHYGYMTEAVEAFCRFALQQEGVQCVTAETDLDGYASQRILKRCGFVEDSRGETVWWKLLPGQFKTQES